MRRHGQAGFTIVEIVSVVGIIGVLAILVLPSIRVNAVRVKMSEALLAFGQCRNTITEIYLANGEPPADGVWGCEIDKDVSRYVYNVKVDPVGIIMVGLTGFGDLRIDTFDVTLAPLDNTGSLPSGNGAPIRRWRCGSPGDGTTILPQFLPSSCRG
jgi:type IV pilus assembly protein PilA